MKKSLVGFLILLVFQSQCDDFLPILLYGNQLVLKYLLIQALNGGKGRFSQLSDPKRKCLFNIANYRNYHPNFYQAINKEILEVFQIM